MENNWVFYLNNFDFSESFKTKLSKQLQDKLYSVYNLDRSKPNPIKLMFGLQELNQRISHGYIFSSASILITELDEMFPVSICWKSADFTDLKSIQKSDLNNKNVEFEWCDDFPVEKLKASLSKEKVYKKINNLNYIIKPNNYPDLVVDFNLKTPLDKEQIKIIENIFKKNKKVYVSDLTNNSIMLDFQIDTINFKDEDFNRDIEYLASSIEEISKFEFSDKIENIEIK